MRRYFYFLFLGLLFGGLSFATSYYVDNSCANNGDGTTVTCGGAGAHGPFNSIANAQTALTGSHPGDSLLLQGGETFRELYTVPAYGTNAGQFVVGSYGTGNAIINGASVAPSGSWTSEYEGGTDFTADANLQAYWYFDNAWTDGTANANTLTPSATPPTFDNTAGEFVQGTYSSNYLGSSSERATRADADLSTGFIGKNGSTNTEMTVGGWARPTVTTGGSIFVKGGNPNWTLAIPFFSTGGSIRCRANLDAGSRTIQSNAGYSADTWYHTVCRVTAATKLFEIFVNNVKQTSNYTATSTTLYANTAALEVGHDATTGYFTGQIDEFFVFNRALTDAEITSIYSFGLNGARGAFTTYYQTGFTQPRAVFETLAGVPTAMTVAASKAAMTAGSWYWDAGNSRVYVRATGNVDPATETIEVNQRASCLSISHDYTTVQSLTCQEAYSQGILTTGNYTLIQNNLFQHLRSPNGNSGDGNGVRWTAGSHQTVQNNTFTDDEWGLTTYISNGVTSDSNLIQNNTLYNIDWDGINPNIAAGGSYTNTIIQNNTIYNMGTGVGGGIQGIGVAFSDGTGTGNIARWNTTYGNGTVSNPGIGYAVQGGASNTTFYGNVAHDNYGTCILVSGGSSNSVYNNTCYNDGLATNSDSELHLSSSTTSNTIKNGIYYATSGQNLVHWDFGIAGNTVNFNLYQGGASTAFNLGGTHYNFSGYQSNNGSQDANAENVDPQFVKTSANNFSLLMTSPAIAGGTSVSLAQDFYGIAVIPGFVSLGAIQFQPRPAVGAEF